MINFIPELEARGNPSTTMNFLVPLIAVILTIITGSIIFALMGFDPIFALHTFFFHQFLILMEFQNFLLKQHL